MRDDDKSEPMRNAIADWARAKGVCSVQQLRGAGYWFMVVGEGGRGIDIAIDRLGVATFLGRGWFSGHVEGIGDLLDDAARKGAR